jgi:hypothetical protein
MESYIEEKPDEEITRALGVLLFAAAGGVVIAREVSKRGLPPAVVAGISFLSAAVIDVVAERVTRPNDQHLLPQF